MEKIWSCALTFLSSSFGHPSFIFSCLFFSELRFNQLPYTCGHILLLRWNKKVFIVLIFLFDLFLLYFPQIESSREFGRKRVVESEKDWLGGRGSSYYVRHPSALLVSDVGKKPNLWGLWQLWIVCLQAWYSTKANVWVDTFWLLDFFLNLQRLD